MFFYVAKVEIISNNEFKLSPITRIDIFFTKMFNLIVWINYQYNYKKLNFQIKDYAFETKILNLNII